jgi:UDP-N-acetyl-2-amino-2-deoxyglucuronate dehydrogenase
MFSTITDRKIRIGLVGCGRISSCHFESITAHADDLELVAICDNDERQLRMLGSGIQCRSYLHMEEMLQKEDLDLVVLCTPSGLHPSQAISAAEAGVNVMTEKPMATKWADGLRMVTSCDEAGVRLFVIKQNRRNATLQLLKRAVQERRFGRIFMVNINVLWTRPQEYYDSANWRGTWELDGGALMNQASHYVDLVDWLIGPVDSVQAMTETIARDIEVEDSGVLNIRWCSGALGSMCVTMLTYPKNYEGSITIIGEKGTVKIGGIAVNHIEHWEFEEQKDYDKEVLNSSFEPDSVYGSGHTAYYKNVIDVLRGRSEPATDGRDGLKSLEVLIAAYLSAKDGRTVSLPLEY